MARQVMIALAICCVMLGWAVGPLPADQPGKSDPPGPAGPKLLWAGPAVEVEPTAADQPAASQPAERANPLPGITIDKQRRRVMLDAQSLQPGALLELVACMPNSREHEAIVLIRARPQRVHLALLLCGYEPGAPASWDEQNEKAIPPSGDPVDIMVEWVDPKTEKKRTAPIEDWMAATDPAKPVPKLTWLFTGSRRFENGQYLADLEGSIVSISNFPDAVLDLPGLHSRDNAALAFKGNERVMPPAGTPCTLILLPPATLRVEMDRFGKVKIHGRAVLPDRLGEMLAAHQRSRDDARVELLISPDAVAADADKLVELCRKAEFPADRIDRKPPTTQPGASLFPANNPQAALDILAAQWLQHRVALAGGLAAQQQWLANLEQRRAVFERQYEELTGYLGRAGRQYRQAIDTLTRN